MTFSSTLQLKTSRINLKTQKRSSSPSTTRRTVVRRILPLDMPVLNESARVSQCSSGVIAGYGVNTSAGLVKNFNEDRVSVVYSMPKPPHFEGSDWPVCSYFGVFDGHGGSACADFLRDNLCSLIIKQDSFPDKPKAAIEDGFKEAENAWYKHATKNRSIIETSGSCAIVMLIVGEICYIANLGDSRAVLSAKLGTKVHALTKDHKPNDESERARILEAGGEVFQSQITSGSLAMPGVYRINPGRLSVSRAFGDIQAKEERYGGNHKVLIATPDIRIFRITESFDFIILACDGVYDKLSNKEVVTSAWNGLQAKYESPHGQMGQAADSVLRAALANRSTDNVTALLVGFKNFKKPKVNI